MANGTAGISSYGGALPGTFVNQREIQARGGLGGAAGFSTAPVEAYVYLGPDYERMDLVDAPVSKSPAAGDYQARQSALTAYRPVSYAVAMFDMLTPQQRKQWSDLVAKNIGYEGSIERQRSLWESTTLRAAQLGQITQQPISAWQLMQQDAEYEAGRRAAKGSGGAYTGPVTQVRLTDPDTAMALIDQSLQGALGRSASQKEKQRFMSALREYEMQNPTVTTGDKTGSVTTGGSNPQVFAQRFAQAQEGSAEFSTATTFLDAFLGALGNPVK
jgi:hypothetical protein